MKIAAIKLPVHFFKKNNTPEQKQAKNTVAPNSTPAFNYQIQMVSNAIAKNKALFECFINKEGRLTNKEYKHIKNKRPALILKAYSYIDKNNTLHAKPKDYAAAALNLKDYLDKTEPDEPYTLIAMGTSTSIFAETMKNLGCDVVFLPVSNLKCVDYEIDDMQTSIDYYKNLSKVFDYLISKGVNNNSKRKYILMDFVSTGQTLATMYDFFLWYLKIPVKQVRVFSLEDTIKAANVSAKYQLKDKQIDKLIDDVFCTRVSAYSNTPHFNVDNVVHSKDEKNHSIFSDNLSNDELFSKFERYSTPLARAFSLCVMNEVDNLRKKNPDKAGLML